MLCRLVVEFAVTSINWLAFKPLASCPTPVPGYCTTNHRWIKPQLRASGQLLCKIVAVNTYVLFMESVVLNMQWLRISLYLWMLLYSSYITIRCSKIHYCRNVKGPRYMVHNDIIIQIRKQLAFVTWWNYVLLWQPCITNQGWCSGHTHHYKPYNNNDVIITIINEVF